MHQQASAAQRARDVLDAVQPPALEAVEYRSLGRALVVAGADDARAARACEVLTGAGLRCTWLVTTGQANAVGDVQHVHAALEGVRGHLGAFAVDMRTGDGELRPLAPSLLTANAPLDLVLDLGEQPAVSAALTPPGYYAPRDEESFAGALAELPELVGEFEKPRYFHYDANICAHGRNGLPGCTRCLDACPAEAITSLRDFIEVDPHLCQGGGICATACPTGAITYTQPPAAQLVDALREALRAWREAGGDAPVVLFASEAGLAELEAETLPAHILPVALEESASAGAELWLAALAFGACEVRVLVDAGTPPVVRAELETQLEVAAALCTATGLGGSRLALVTEVELALAPTTHEPTDALATFAGVVTKRDRLRLAADALAQFAGGIDSPAPLPVGAPFGTLEVDSAACTLCMACVSTCPAGALIAGGDRPALFFVEANCVQCGLCEKACPEDAVERSPRYVFDAAARMARQTLNEDQPWPCPQCGKQFATTRIIDRIRERLSGHWMYADNPAQLARLELCEECRVKDLYRDGGGLLDG